MSSEVVIALFIPLASVATGVITQRMARGAQRSASFDSLAERLDKAEVRLDESLRRERRRDDYIHQLRDHISQGNPPPPPPWPAGLTT